VAHRSSNVAVKNIAEKLADVGFLISSSSYQGNSILNGMSRRAGHPVEV